MEELVNGVQQTMAEQKLQHTEELTNLRRRMRAELETERQRLLNQIREQTKLKAEVSAKVSWFDFQIIINLFVHL